MGKYHFGNTEYTNKNGKSDFAIKKGGMASISSNLEFVLLICKKARGVY